MLSVNGHTVNSIQIINYKMKGQYFSLQLTGILSQQIVSALKMRSTKVNSRCNLIVEEVKD